MSEPSTTQQQPSQRRSALAIALIVASFVGLYTLWAIEQPELTGNAAIYFVQRIFDWVILPGIIVGVLSNATLHVASRWILIGANFLIYFAVTYAIARFWSKRKAKAGAQQRTDL